MQLVEREKETTALARLYKECTTGHSRIAIINGALGSGKTALLHRLTDEAALSGALVLEAVASNAERLLPLGVADQIFRILSSSDSAAEPQTESLLNDIHKAIAEAQRPGNTSRLIPSVINHMYRVLYKVASRQPLVVCVDDTHFIDTASLEYFLALIRRMSCTRTLFVFSGCVDMNTPVRQIFCSEILRLRLCTEVRLEPLSTAGVAAVLAEEMQIAADAAVRIAPECRRVSGGKPFLVRALASDSVTYSTTSGVTGAIAPLSITVGEAFAQAVLNCLHRSDCMYMKLAQAVAILGHCESTDLLSQLLNIDPEPAEQVMRNPALGGLLEPDSFEHPSVRRAVLSDMSPDLRRAMHSRAACLLREAGASASAVAQHVIHADEITSREVSTLRAAAAQALVDNDTNTAVSYLRRVYLSCVEERDRASVAAELIEVIWRANPDAGRQYIPELTVAIGKGYLTAHQSLQVVMKLLWFGQMREATSALMLLRKKCRMAMYQPIPCVEHLRLWLPYLYPRLSKGLMRNSTITYNPVADVWATGHKATGALDAALRGNLDDEAVTSAELVLRQTRLDDMPLTSLIAALTALIYSDQLGKAAEWCDFFLTNVNDRYSRLDRALLTTVRANIHYCHGELAHARREAHRALALMPAEGWGTAIAAPLAFLLLSETAMGNYRNAASYLNFPVPDAAFETFAGIYYLDARGRFFLAIGNYDAAVEDFAECGRLMKLWEIDYPAVVPWRSNAARVYVCKGMFSHAGELVQEQISLLGPVLSRAHAITYRAQAATLSPGKRLSVLEKAAGIFERCGDVHGLACTLTDLSHASNILGEHSHARDIAERARKLAKRCGAAPLLSSLANISSDFHDDHPADTLNHFRRVTSLSDAERRVAALAADGFTNQQIAKKLFITVSTVEQHLTHVYRKLAISRRGELSSRLRLPQQSPERPLATPVHDVLTPSPAARHGSLAGRRAPASARPAR